MAAVLQGTHPGQPISCIFVWYSYFRMPSALRYHECASEEDPMKWNPELNSFIVPEPW